MDKEQKAKRLENEKEWEHPNSVLLREYKSIVEVIYENILRPIVQKDEPLDKIQTSFLKNDLENTIYHVEHSAGVSQETRDAYKNLKKFSDALNDLDEEKVQENFDVLKNVFSLLISCSAYGNTMKIIYQGMNPCRKSQYSFLGAVTKTKVGQGNTEFIAAAESLYNTCIMCPYKQENNKPRLLEE